MEMGKDTLRTTPTLSNTVCQQQRFSQNQVVDLKVSSAINARRRQSHGSTASPVTHTHTLVSQHQLAFVQYGQ